jgi:uncharacterized membrane protein YcfT
MVIYVLANTKPHMLEILFPHHVIIEVLAWSELCIVNFALSDANQFLIFRFVDAITANCDFIDLCK